MSKKIGFIGAGNMGGCLIQAAIKAVSPDNICIFDTDSNKCKHYTDTCGVSSVSLEEVINSQIVVIGVKPQGYKALIDSVKDKICQRDDDFAVVSMAAGITIDSVCKMFGKDIPVIRIMPNMACNTEEGVMVYDISENLSEKSLKTFCEAFEYVGLTK